MDVGETFLHQPKHHQLHLARESAEIFRDADTDIHAAALCETLDIPTQSHG